MKRTLCAVGLASLCLKAAPAGGAALDHLKCFKIKDPQAKAKYTADLDVVSGTAGGISEPGCTIKVPAIMACVPTVKTNVTPTPPGIPDQGTPNSFFCYKVKCPAVAHPALSGTDQFGSRTVEVKTGSRLLCAPLAGPPTTTSTTPSSTTTTTLTAGCPLPATGQTTCWDSTGTVIPCAGTGQDGDLQKGAALAYTDNGDGTITDVNTGLMWEKQSNDGSVHSIGNTYTWDQAFSGHVATLNTMSFAGHTDWRVPNYKELVSILNLQNAGPPAVSPAFNNNCLSGCTVLTCSCTAPYPCWSSTSWAFGPTYAWFLDFVHFGGEVYTSGKGNGYAVRGVRGGS